MNDGWLCDSILNTAARPSPMSTAPAFSPGPCSTRGPSVGSVFRWMRLLLYEQCSDHMTEKRPSSVRFGSRPRALADALVLLSVRSCWARSSAVGITAILCERPRPLEHREISLAVRAPLPMIACRPRGRDAAAWSLSARGVSVTSARDAEPPVTHGICAPCTARQHWRDSPVLVVARHRAGDARRCSRHLLQGSPRGADRGRPARRTTGGDAPGGREPGSSGAAARTAGGATTSC